MREATIINEFIEVNKRMKHLSNEVSRILVDHNVMLTAIKTLLIEKKIITAEEFQEAMTKVVTDITSRVEKANATANAAKNNIEQPTPIVENTELLKTEK